MPSALDRVAELAVAPLDGQGVTRDEARELLVLAAEDLPAVLYWSDRIRRRHRGDRVSLCGIVAAKVGRCSEDCAWCSQSAHHNTGVQVHGLLDNDTLLRRARESADVGAACFGLVTSGAAPTAEELDRLCQVLRRIRDEGRVMPCASLGMLDEAMARRLAEAGCRRYNHNLETSPRHYARVVTTHRFADRAATARAVKAAGMELCSGGLIGIGETPEDRVDLALEVRQVRSDVVPVNFFNPVPGTRAAAEVPPLSPRECLAVLAMFRFVLPTPIIKVAGGREVNLRDLQSWLFAAGADGFIIGNYLTTAGRPAEADLQMIADLGLSPVSCCSPPGGAAGSCGASCNHV
jgi:biotin synthase